SSLLKEDMLSKSAYVFMILLMLFAPLSQGKSLSSMPTRDLEFFRISRFGIIGHDEDSRDRMFDTQFPGLDIAGYYIRDNSMPDERLFHSSHQSFGVLWHAERKGYKPPNSVEEFKRAESDFNVTWIFAYQWGIATYLNNPEIFGYLKDNYRLVQFAYVPQGDKGQPVYFLFRKGGTFNETSLNELLSNKQTFKTTYSYTSGPYDLYTINIE
ncbi:MAG: hypothetical protein NDI94_04180, partial [Candidatus Woesearchaeota archaeon]|nr:hypothetical protein [Candidatus Woesearchaeota archaeon]